MGNLSNWMLTDEEKDKFIDLLTPELIALRTKAEISQEDISTLIGISRQTYSAMELKKRKMSWNTYLSLIMFYDYNQKTHQMLRAMGIFPYEIIKRFNNGVDLQNVDISTFLGESMKPIIESLDEQALMSIRTMIMVEYARCTSTPGEVVVKSFDGVSFTPITTEDRKVAEAIESIKRRKKRND